MILLYAIAVGFIAGWTRARIDGRRMAVPDLLFLWLVPVAFLPQGLAFFVPYLRRTFSDEVASVTLVTSLFVLLVFAWLNRRVTGFRLLILGLLLNLTVILANGGLMPISPETILRMEPNAPLHLWPEGTRIWGSKDVLLATENTNLAWLSDRFVMPRWTRHRVAFSIGDVVLAAGAFWFLWQSGRGGRQASRQFGAQAPETQ